MSEAGRVLSVSICVCEILGWTKAGMHDGWEARMFIRFEALVGPVVCCVMGGLADIDARPPLIAVKRHSVSCATIANRPGHLVCSAFAELCARKPKSALTPVDFRTLQQLPEFDIRRYAGRLMTLPMQQIVATRIICRTLGVSRAGRATRRETRRDNSCCQYKALRKRTTPLRQTHKALGKCVNGAPTCCH